MYKIIFIDEQKTDIEDFKDYVEETNSNEKFEVIGEFPQEEFEEMVQVIFKHNPDAIITDFMLNEMKEDIKYNVPYNGVQLVQEILSIRESFPCFVMTSFDDNAIKASDDVNLVYIKNILHGSEKAAKVKANFLQRVESQIIHYKSKIANAENKLRRLLELRDSNNATIEDEEEIIRLDHFLEKSIDKRNAIPEEYKSLSNTKRLKEIISKVDELLKKVDKRDDE
jgi:DNA-binding NarL/FixJ family response regulator